MMKKLIALLIFIAPLSVASVYASDCAPVAQKVASDQGGQLSRVEPFVKDGQDMCLVVVVIPERDGEKPRRIEVAVPAK